MWVIFPPRPLVFSCSCCVSAWNSSVQIKYVWIRTGIRQRVWQTERKRLRVFSLQALFLHLTVFHPQHSYGINYSLHLPTVCVCACVGECVCVCTVVRARLHAFILSCVCTVSMGVFPVSVYSELITHFCRWLFRSMCRFKSTERMNVIQRRFWHMSLLAPSKARLKVRSWIQDPVQRYKGPVEDKPPATANSSLMSSR